MLKWVKALVRGLYPILPPLLSIMYSLHHRRLLSPHPSLTSFLYVFCLPQTFVIPPSLIVLTQHSPPKTFFLSASPCLPLHLKHLSPSSQSVHHALSPPQTLVVSFPFPHILLVCALFTADICHPLPLSLFSHSTLSTQNIFSLGFSLSTSLPQAFIPLLPFCSSCPLFATNTMYLFSPPLLPSLLLSLLRYLLPSSPLPLPFLLPFLLLSSFPSPPSSSPPLSPLLSPSLLPLPFPSPSLPFLLLFLLLSSPSSSS